MMMNKWFILLLVFALVVQEIDATRKRGNNKGGKKPMPKNSPNKNNQGKGQEDKETPKIENPDKKTPMVDIPEKETLKINVPEKKTPTKRTPSRRNPENPERDIPGKIIEEEDDNKDANQGDKNNNKDTSQDDKNDNNGWGDKDTSQENSDKEMAPNQFLSNGPFFSIPLTIGSQKARVNVGIEGYFGSSLIYGKGVACDGSAYYCVPHDTFDHMSSSTFKVHRELREFNLSLTHVQRSRLGASNGLAGSDDIQLGTLKLKDTMFGVSKNIPLHLSYKTKVSGFLAMGAPVKEEDEKTTMQKIVEQASKPTITFYAPSDMYGQHAITIGGEDTAHCKNNWMKFKNQPSVDSNNMPWTINFEGFKWGKYSFLEKMNVALSPAADFFVAPRRHSDALWKQFGARYNPNYFGAMIDCAKRDSAPNLEFKVGDKKLIVTPQQYIKKFDSSHCLLNIYADDQNQWIMPYMFFQKYCVKFDYGMKEVSIAEQM